jgi:glyceronephosphate O-acyltransferase
MTQFFYGGVSPKEAEIHPMLQRVDVCNGPRADVSAAVAAGVLSVESAVFVMVLNAQLLGTDTAAALKPYENFLRTVWSVNPHVGAAAASPSTHSTTTAASPLSHARQGGLIVVADEIYRVAAAALVKTIAAEVPTTVSWFVQLAFVHAMDPPALEFGAAEVAVEGLTGLSHGGTLPLLCAANALGVLRHFPVSRSEPATVTPVDVALNAALLGHILLCCGQLPECSDACKTDTSKTEETPVNKGDAAGAATASARPHMASFAVAESHNPAEASLVWGMFGEYLMGYYGRFAQQIHAAFPVADVVTATPLLQFPFNVRDIANFGPEPRCPAYLLEGWRAYQQRQRVTDKFHGASVTRRMQAYVQQLDDTLCSIVDAARAAVSREQRAAAAVALRRRASATSSFAMPPYCLEEFNVAAYQHMLRRLTTHYSLMPYHQCVALTAVDWEAYISIIARAALVHLANCVLRRTEDPAAKLHRVTGALTVDIPGIAGVTRAPQSPANVLQADSGAAKSAEPTAATAVVPFNFPEPRRSFTNDLIYHGEARIPPFPSLTRQLLTYATFLHRTALRPSGWRSDMTPGMTPKALTTILAQPHIQQLMTTLAAKDGVAKAEVEAQAKNILLLAGDTLNHPQCRTMGLMVREVFKRIYQRVNVNHGAFERLHRQLQMPRVALVFVPLHRSYIDFLILSFLLAEMQSPLPHIVAGDGFLSMGPIATLMRGSGAFFMRRTFRGDPLYAALFKEYVRQMTLRYRPLEFFIEGTRSRTGKTMAPKIGILKFVCDTFFDPGQQELDDVLFIPVSLSYDELLEAPMYAKELLGVPKPKETLANFFKASSTLKRMHGSIHLRMGDAVSLRSLKEHPQQCPLPYQPKNDMIKAGEAAAAPSVARAGEAEKNSGSSADGIGGSSSRGEGLPLRKLSLLNTTPTLAKSVSHTPPSLLSSVAWHLTYRLQRNIVVTPASMVAALLECFIPYYTTRSSRAEAKKAASVAKETPEAASPAGPSGASPSAREEIGVPLTVMEQGVMWLRGILKERGACLSVEAATWDTDRVVKTGLGHLHCFAHLTNSMSTVSYQQPDNVVTRLGVNISTNQLIHICMDEALVVVVAQAFGTPTTPHHPPTAERATVCGTRAVKTEVLANHTQLLQRLLATEFPNYASSSPVSFASWLECTVSRLQHSRSLSVDATASSSAQASASSREGSATAVYSHGPITSLPVTQYYYFLLQLICPHLEALYVVLIACSTLLQAYPGLPLGAADVVNTTQKVCRSLFEEHTLNYAVTANKETLQHYYESLIALSLLQLGRLPPPPPSPTTSGAKGKTVKPSQGIVVYKAGSLGQGKVLERLDVLASQVQKFLWYPEAEMECAVDACVVKERVLTVYKELTQSSKI